ncbi:PEPxxWA-CTERM sorting domain-containing protein [Glacieibacterium frigidum]|uniref:PEPxxWA-CTERM sorting domain-containing protein n=1 Tax=Glacieibacterium frigidum TaxID=2593303 RepID=UPI00163D8D80|nr:PEPxxWA-CTERM sorting domain-containing protein [Glacieibacterium frigidum]
MALCGMALAVPTAAAEIVAAGTAGTTGATALYLTLPSELTASEALTVEETASFLGRPDDVHTGIGSGFITYDFGSFRLVDGAGADFNVYEVDFGTVEFASADILVSADGLTFFNVEGTGVAAVDLAGDETHSVATWRRSYDLGAAVTALGVSQFRFLRLDGTSSGGISGNNGFDPDAVAGINFIDLTPPVGGVPEPGTWALMIGGFGLVGGAMRRRTALATVAA